MSVYLSAERSSYPGTLNFFGHVIYTNNRKGVQFTVQLTDAKCYISCINIIEDQTTSDAIESNRYMRSVEAQPHLLKFTRDLVDKIVSDQKQGRLEHGAYDHVSMEVSLDYYERQFDRFGWIPTQHEIAHQRRKEHEDTMRKWNLLSVEEKLQYLKDKGE